MDGWIKEINSGRIIIYSPSFLPSKRVFVLSTIEQLCFSSMFKLILSLITKSVDNQSVNSRSHNLYIYFLNNIQHRKFSPSI